MLYKIYDYGNNLKETKRFAPSPEQWEKFWNECGKAKIWHWKKRYQNKNIIDGYGWMVDIKFGDKIIQSSGSNESPQCFDCFLESVRKIIGGLEFS